MTVVLPRGVSSGFLRMGGNVPGKLVAPDKFTPFEKRVPGDMSHPDPRASPDAPLDMEPVTAPPRMDRSQAVQSGFTGDACDQCGSMRMKVSGHCNVCEECGTSTGCS